MNIILSLKQLFYRVVDSFRLFKTGGIRAGAVRLGWTIANIFYQRREYVVMEKTLSDPTTEAQSFPDLTVRLATTLEEIDGLGPVTPNDKMERYHKLFSIGSKAFIAYQNDQAVGCCWYSEDTGQSIHRVASALRLQPGDAYPHDGFISRTHRSKGIGGAMISYRMQYMQGHGIKRVFAVVNKDNPAAIGVTRNVGYQPIGEIHHTRILFWDSVKPHIAGQ